MHPKPVFSNKYCFLHPVDHFSFALVLQSRKVIQKESCIFPLIMPPVSKIFFLVLSLTIYTQVLLSQDFQWWDQKHGYTGAFPRTDLIVIAPAVLGPNALPVPPIKNGQIPNGFSLEFGGEGHFHPGDRTLGIWGTMYTPLFSDRAGLHLSWVPIEFYSMDTITRDLRRSMDRDGKGNNTTDLYISTYIALVKDHATLPDVLLTLNLRTATGSGLGNARTSNMPGYFFDLSIGKTFEMNRSVIKEIRPHIMGGIYVWQTNYAWQEQNDAVLFGAGVDLEMNRFSITNTFGGYAGYIGNGDDPLVFRVQVNTRLRSKVNYHVQFQHGLNDYPFTSVRLGLRYTP